MAPDHRGWGVVPEEVAEFLVASPGMYQSVGEFRALLGLDLTAVRSVLRTLHNSNLIQVGPQPLTGLLIPRSVRPPNFLILRVTEHCNLNCLYCFEDAGTDKRGVNLSPAIACKGIDEFLEVCGPSANLLFIGGEALLRRELVRQVAEYARRAAARYGKELYFSLQTNGTVWAPWVLDFAREYGVAIGLSFDANSQSHDFARPFDSGKGSAAVIWDNIQSMLAAGLRVSLMITLGNHNLGTIIEDLLHLQAEGIERVKFSILSNQGRCRNETGFLLGSEAYAEMIWRLIGEIEAGRLWKLRVEQIINIMHRLMLLDDLVICESAPCGAASEFVSVMPDGNYYPCDCFDRVEEFTMGKVGEGLRGSKQAADIRQKLLNRTTTLLEPCRSCENRSVCSAGCAKDAHARYGTISLRDPFFCEVSKTLIPKIMWKLGSVPESRLRDYYFEHFAYAKPIL